MIWLLILLVFMAIIAIIAIITLVLREAGEREITKSRREVYRDTYNLMHGIALTC